MNAEAFWRHEDGSYFANPASAGPWRADTLMGRAVTGLLGHEIERQHMRPGLAPARFTVDLHGLPDFSRTTVETRVIRQGGRLTLVEAELVCGGTSRARATCQILPHTEAPQGRVWSPEPWDVPPPETLPDDRVRPWRWTLRMIEGSFGQAVQRRAWMRDYRELIEGVPLSPFSRVALAADFASPLTHGGERGVEYINTDAAVYLHRLPEGEWIGFDQADHQATAGIALGHARLYDLHGPIGFGSATAMAQRRPAKG